MPTAPPRGRPNVKLVRGPFLKLEPHPDHVVDAAGFRELCARLRGVPEPPLLVADLFSGAGGMSLGLERAGMKVVFGADHDPDALETHAHHFAGLSAGWDLGDPAVVAEVGDLLRSVEIDVLAGGPPCQPFSKAGRAGMRHLVRQGIRDAHDKRRDLWESYLEVIRLAKPRVVIMENVPEMALDREMFILRTIVLTLEHMGYSVRARVTEAWRYGVPQFRQRLIRVAMRDGRAFEWPEEVTKKVTVTNAISDLPAVEGGWRPKGGAKGWADYRGPRTDFQRVMRGGVAAEDACRVYDHITRPVRPDDLAAFELLDTNMRYSELPEALKRYRDDIFDDKYKRLDGDHLSRTITAHISKDGYWYIHPEQNRTLTVREAARIQTFPDDFRFAASPTAAFRQIGNAVPPFLAEAIGGQVLRTLQAPPRRALKTHDTAGRLAAWFDADQTWAPWLRTGNRWLTLVGETILGSESPANVRSIWAHLSKLANPDKLLASAPVANEVASWLDKASAAEHLILAAERAVASETPWTVNDELLAELVAEKVITRVAAELAMIVDAEGEEPIIATAGALRVAGRFELGRERWLTNRNTDGRLAIGQLVGFADKSRRAHLGLITLGATTCTPKAPACEKCPLREWCRYQSVLGRSSS